VHTRGCWQTFVDVRRTVGMHSSCRRTLCVHPSRPFSTPSSTLPAMSPRLQPLPWHSPPWRSLGHRPALATRLSLVSRARNPPPVPRMSDTRDADARTARASACRHEARRSEAVRGTCQHEAARGRRNGPVTPRFHVAYDLELWEI